MKKPDQTGAAMRRAAPFQRCDRSDLRAEGESGSYLRPCLSTGEPPFLHAGVKVDPHPGGQMLARTVSSHARLFCLLDGHENAQLELQGHRRLSDLLLKNLNIYLTTSAVCRLSLFIFYLRGLSVNSIFASSWISAAGCK